MKLKTAIERFNRQLAANGRSGHTRAAISVNRTKSALRSFFALCVESGLCEGESRAADPVVTDGGQITLYSHRAGNPPPT